MPRNGTGQYNPLTNTWNPPVTGVLATGSDFQAQLNDISAAISQSISKDGQTPMTASFPMGNNSIVGIASGTAAAPSISPINDANTGVYFPAADTVGVAVGGVNVGNFTSAGFSGNAATATNATNLVNGNATLAAGTAAAPSLTTTGDTNTGVYFPAADTVAIATAGTERARFTSGGNLLVGTTVDSGYRATFSGGSSVGGTTVDAILLRNSGYGGSNIASTNQNGLVLSQIDFATEDVGVSNFDDGIIRFLTRRDAVSGGAITEAARLTSDGNWLVGDTTASGRLTVKRSTDGTIGYFAGSTTQFRIDVASSIINLNAQNGSGVMAFQTNGTERARITSGGDLLVGTTSAVDSAKVSVTFQVGSANGISLQTSGTSYNYNLMSFLAGPTQVGYIFTNGTTTSYGITSDYRLKENIQPMTGALAKVAALKPCIYKWKSDGSNGEGFIAHELAEVVPDAVTGEKDAVNEDGSIRAQGIDTSFLVATLTAAIKEQQTLIESLTARITALEAK